MQVFFEAIMKRIRKSENDYIFFCVYFFVLIIIWLLISSLVVWFAYLALTQFELASDMMSFFF